VLLFRGGLVPHDWISMDDPVNVSLIRPGVRAFFSGQTPKQTDSIFVHILKCLSIVLPERIEMEYSHSCRLPCRLPL
jgi:hypothetical protein